MEAAVSGRKLITNNSAIKASEMYRAENIFILQEHKMEELPAFLDIPFSPLPDEFFKKNLFFGWLKVILGYEEN